MKNCLYYSVLSLALFAPTSVHAQDTINGLTIKTQIDSTYVFGFDLTQSRSAKGGIWNVKTGKADLKAESMAEIVKVHEYMKANPSVMFEVQGHCDSTGNAAKNRTLSQERADAIRNALIQLDAMYASRLTAVGKSSDVPVASNDTEEGRAKNRRVEFVVTNK